MNEDCNYCDGFGTFLGCPICGEQVLFQKLRNRNEELQILE